jgi:hypothetical protein
MSLLCAHGPTEEGQAPDSWEHWGGKATGGWRPGAARRQAQNWGGGRKTGGKGQESGRLLHVV